MSSLRVLIADDDRGLAEALRDAIDVDPDLQVVGTAQDASEATALALSLRPDVCLLDVRMPGGGGPAAARGIRLASPGAALVAYSAYEDESSIQAMLAEGVRGYLLKGCPAAEINEALRRAAAGESTLSARAATRVVHELGAKLRAERETTRERVAVLERVSSVLEGEQLSIVLQPVVELRSGRIVGLEALSRFALLPARPPTVWFAEAASVGLGIDLELAALRKAFALFGRLHPSAYLSVNISPETGCSPRFRDALQGVSLDRLVLEITEHAEVADYEAFRSCLAGIRAAGARLAIDDAGAGFASFRHILELDPDLIKLDITLIRDIDVDRQRRALAAGLVSFARESGATITAEGIETVTQLRTLRELGVRFGQGYLLGAPGAPPQEERVALPTEQPEQEPVPSA